MTEPDFDSIERFKESANAAWLVTVLLVLTCYYFLRHLMLFLMEWMYGFFIQKNHSAKMVSRPEKSGPLKPNLPQPKN